MIGYDAAARILINVSDYTQMTMIAAGNWGEGKHPKFEGETRPWAEAAKRKRAAQASEGVSIMDLHSIFTNKAK